MSVSREVMSEQASCVAYDVIFHFIAVPPISKDHMDAEAILVVDRAGAGVSQTDE
jgi:hypothetical protein